MTPVASPVKLTYEDFLHFPEDGKRHELIDGEHFVTPAPALRHQEILINLLSALRPHVLEHQLGRVYVAPVDVVLSETDVVEPDLLFVATAHLDRLTEANVQGPPDLVVEVVSETGRRRDEVTKRHLYERYGVAEYWVVDPVIETVKVYRAGADGRYQRRPELSLEQADTLESPLFPGLALALSEIFV